MSKNPTVTDETEAYEQITQAEEARLRKWIDRDGPQAVAKTVGISRATVGNCLARMRVQRGTIAAIREALSKVNLREKSAS